MAITPPSNVVRVAVIGAGASGLSQIKQLRDAFNREDVKASGKTLEVVCYEKGREVGGVWYIDEEKVKGKSKPYHSVVLPVDAGADDSQGGEVDRLVIYPKATDEGDEPSAMYDGLRTNLPHDIMAFRDLPAPSQDPLAPAVNGTPPLSPPASAAPSSASTASSSGPATPIEGPVRFSSLYPPRREMQAYLELYARTFDLYRSIRFHTTVTRLYTQTEGGQGEGRRWKLHSRSAAPVGEEEKVEEYDYVCVANGHYTDAWTPVVRGLSTFPGQILHSRYYNSPAPFSGKKVLVVGSFASGGDIARLMSLWNLDNANTAAPVDIHVSCSALTLYSTPKDDPSQPWGKYITYHPLISSIASSTVHFADESKLEGGDAILFATGYVFALPFCKREDAPWNEEETESLLKETVKKEDKSEIGQWEAGGLKGQGMRTEGMDELLMFRKGDRTLAFPGLAYQVVPFPMVELQARLTSLLWSGALDLPASGSPSLSLPHNPSNPTSPIPPRDAHHIDEAEGEAQQAASKGEGQAKEPVPIRGAFAKRGQFVFNSPYEWEYSDHLMRLMLPAGSGQEGKDVQEYWKRTEGWRRERRADKTLRKRILGF